MSVAAPLWPEPTRIRLPERKGAAGNSIAPIELSVYIAGEGPAVVLAHGFPELAYSWRHQVRPLVDAGFQVIIPDQRGYGASDSPSEISDFDLEHLSADLIGLLDALEIERAVFAGHDWGGAVVWAMPILYPDRTAGIIGVNTPNVAFPGTDMLRLAFPDPEKLYMLWFQEPGVAEGVIDDKVSLVVDRMYRKMDRVAMKQAVEASTGSMNPFIDLEQAREIGEPLLNAKERATYIDAFVHSGFRGGINWYRNLDRNAEMFPDIGKKVLDIPCLMITAECDLALRPEMADGMKNTCNDLEVHMIENCGHWTQQEKPEKLAGLMSDWLKRRHL